MRRFVAGIVVTLAVLALLAQLALPRWLANRTEERLEQGGGSAQVSMSAFPAVTLIDGRGDSIDVRGDDLALDLDDRREEPFERLDGFEEVDVDLRDVEAGSVLVERFELTRNRGADDYELTMNGTTTPRELARELGSRAVGTLGELVGSLAGEALPGGGRIDVPLELSASIASEDGRTDVTQASGSLAGVPAGPLAEIVLAAVLERL